VIRDGMKIVVAADLSPQRQKTAGMKRMVHSKHVISFVILIALGLALVKFDKRLVSKTATLTTRSVTVVDKISKRTLPSFENGGIIFNLHIPKCGGKLPTYFKRNMDFTKQTVHTN
jgi:hypothetical protein